MRIGERIRRARRHAGLSQVQLAETIKVRRSAVSNWESASDIHPTMANLVGIATACEVSLDWLGTGRGAMSVDDCDLIQVADAELVDVPAERRLLAIFRSLPRHSQALVLDLLELLASSRQRRPVGTGTRNSKRVSR
jgi:transcriptional regulator with XRE-family HTH domain